MFDSEISQHAYMHSACHELVVVRHHVEHQRLLVSILLPTYEAVMVLLLQVRHGVALQVGFLRERHITDAALEAALVDVGVALMPV